MIFMFLITNAILGIKFPVGMNEYSKIAIIVDHETLSNTKPILFYPGKY